MNDYYKVGSVFSNEKICLLYIFLFLRSYLLVR